MGTTIKAGDKVFLKHEQRVVGVLRKDGDLEIDDRVEESEILVKLYEGLVFHEVVKFDAFLGWEAGRTTRLNETLSMVEVIR
jgi:hypothetical protein